MATEVATHGGRRIDIRIDFADGVIGIENKPWAADQKLQVADYIAELEAKHPQNRLLIYLSSNGDGPGEDSTGKARDFVKEGSLRVIGYGQLLAWLASCKGVCRSLRVIAFLDEFSDYIAKEFEGVMQMHERDMVVSEVVKNTANVEAAFMVGSALNDVKAKLLDILWAQLREKLLQSYPGDNAELWSSVLSGALSQKIFSEFQEIYVALETRGLLAELN